MTDRPDQENRNLGRPPKTGDLRRDTKPLGRKRRKWWRRFASRKRLAAITLASLALLLAAVVGWWYFVGSDLSGQGGENLSFTPPASLNTLATDYPELATILQDPNMDSAYKEFLLAYETGGEEAALKLAEERGLLNANGDLRLTLELDTTNTAGLEAELEANWIEVTAVSGNLMDIAIPLERLEMMMAAGTIGDFISGITTLEHVVRIRLPKVGVSDVAGLQTTGTPVAPLATRQPSGWQSPDNILIVILGVLACVVAPVLFALGAYLLLSGLGYIRRGRRGDSSLSGSGLRPTGFTPPRRPEPAVPPYDPPSRPEPSLSAQPPPGPPSRPEPSTSAQPSPASPSQVLPRPVPAEPPADAGWSAPPASPWTEAREPQAPAEPSAPPSSMRPEDLPTCPSCGRANRPGAKFCLACGTRMEAPTPPPAAAELVPETAQPPENPAASNPTADALPEHPRFCWNCGSGLRPTSRFCPNCGDPV